MPKKIKELSALAVRGLTEPGFWNVGGVPGLYLVVRESGSRSWILRVKVGDRRRDIGLGGYPEISLASAREKAREAREKIRQGIDPIQERREAREQLIRAQERAVTFEEAARRYLAGKRAEFSNPKHAAQWQATLEKYAFPIIGPVPVGEIELSHVLRVLEPHWLTKTETMSRLRGRIEKVLAWATVHGFRTGGNPATWKGNLDAVLQAPGKVSKVEHYKALPWKELPGFMSELHKREGMAARALEFLILTAARSGEIRGARWSEIDLEGRTWTIPGERMKAGKAHTVPLSDPAMELLHSLPRFIGQDLVFPGARGGPLSDMTLSKLMKAMGRREVPHGFRSTFRDWAAETTNYPNHVPEMALAHGLDSKVEAAYRRGDLLEKRIALMADWAEYCGSATPGRVLEFKGGEK